MSLPWNAETDTDRFIEMSKSFATPARRYHDGNSRPDQVFVFGSNLMGDHAGGAAAFAVRERCAVLGVGQGMQPSWLFHDNPRKSYALPTMAMLGVPLTLEGIKAAVTLFKVFAYVREDLEFFVTAIGTGIAGFTHEEIAPLFADAPLNCVLPVEWQPIITHCHDDHARPSIDQS